MPSPSNLQIAEMLEQVAELLEIKQTDAFRVAAYRRAAHAVSAARQPLWQDGPVPRYSRIPPEPMSSARPVIGS